MIMFGYFLFLISGSMLKVRKSTRRDIAIGLGLVLLVTLGALAECVYHLSSPGSPHKLQWVSYLYPLYPRYPIIPLLSTLSPPPFLFFLFFFFLFPSQMLARSRKRHFLNILDVLFLGI